MPTRTQTLSLLAAGAALRPTPGRTQTNVVRVGVPPLEAYAEAFYASETGIFKRAGLDVRITLFNNAEATSSALVGGSLDVTANNAIAVALAIEHGLPMAILAGGALYSSAAPAMLLCVAKNSPIREARQFEGKTIAMLALGSLSYFVTRAWLVENGANPERVHFIELASSAQPAAIERGTIDGAIIVEPVLSMAKGSLRVLARPYDVIAKEFQISSWITTRDWVSKNPDLAKRFADAIYASARWANAHQSESLPIVARYAKIDIDRIRTMTRDRYATSLGPEQISSLLDFAFEYKAIDRRVDLSSVLVSFS